MNERKNDVEVQDQEPPSSPAPAAWVTMAAGIGAALLLAVLVLALYGEVWPW
jgi:hypothetical protein